jgi:hypothetical protein
VADQPFKVVVKGAPEVAAAFLKFDIDLELEMMAGPKKTAAALRDDVAGRAARFGDSVAANIRARYQGPVAVVESAASQSGDASRRRWNFADELWRRAFEPAISGREEEIYASYELMLDRLIATSGFE